MELDAVRGSQPNVLNCEVVRVPVAGQAVGIIGEKNQTRFKDTHQEQHQNVADKRVNQHAQHSLADGDGVHCRRVSHEGGGAFSDDISGRRNGWREWGGIGYNCGLALVCWLRLSGSAGKLQ